MSSDLCSRKTIKDVFKRYGFSPSKRLGQNFLVDKSVLKKLVKATELTKRDVVLEIGPGIGSLTRELSKRAGKVIAVEKDPKMIQILKETMKDYNNVEIIQGDILKIPDTKYNIQNTKYKVVANLPFYIATPVIRQFLEKVGVQPRQMTLMVQKEVAQRICARPPQMNLLAVSVQFYAKPEIVSYVSKKSFWPQPKVDSAILRIAPLINVDRKLINADLFFKIVKAGFSQPRKMLINNLAKKLKIDKERIKEALQKNKISPSQRAETLTVKDWVKIAQEFSASVLSEKKS